MKNVKKMLAILLVLAMALSLAACGFETKMAIAAKKMEKLESYRMDMDMDMALSMSLLVIRKQIPSLRQADTLGQKLSGYAQHIRSLYISMLLVVALICTFMVLSAQNVLLMLAMVATLMLFLAYPNIYRMKVELGLTDEEMKALFGDSYIPDTKDNNAAD